MNIQDRIKKLETNYSNNTPCFCGKTLVDLWYGTPNADSLTHCPKCKPQSDSWANLAEEALKAENLTDQEGE